MKISTKPTSFMLVGIIFICIFLNPALAEQQLNGLEQINNLRERHLEKSSDLGMLKVGADTINFPWSRQLTQHGRSARSGYVSTSLKKEEILMDSSNSTANVRDLLAINSLEQRDLLYRDSERGDPGDQGLVNSLNISVSGEGDDEFADQVAKMMWQEESIGGRDLNNNHVGNYLSIDVHGISVSAINTMQGGNAVATSNIIIEPVQIIVCPSEVGVKLE